MCGRYYFEMNKMDGSPFIDKLKKQCSSLAYAKGEVYPGEPILVILKEQEEFVLQSKKWGLQRKDHLLINARSETASTKPLFAKMKRCAILCNGFYEWKKYPDHKEKYYIHKPYNSLYLAALCMGNEVVILTGESENEMKNIHHRTPLLMDEKRMISYVQGNLWPKVDNQELLIEAVSKRQQMSLF